MSMSDFTKAEGNLASLVGKYPSSSLCLPSITSWKTSSAEKNDEVSTDDVDEDALVSTLLKSDTLNDLKTSWSNLIRNKTLAHCQTITSSSFMTKFLERLCDLNTTWMPDLVKLVISCDCVSSRIYPGLVERILSSDDLVLLGHYFLHVKDITEKEIVQTLNSILPSEKKLMTAQLSQVISLIVKTPYTENILIEEFRNLNFDKLLVLISHLTTKLKTENVSTQSCIGTVLSWVNLLVDSHYSQIVVNSDAWEVIIDLQEIVSVQMELYEDMIELDVIMSKIEGLRKLGTKPSQYSKYYIEVMSI